VAASKAIRKKRKQTTKGRSAAKKAQPKKRTKTAAKKVTIKRPAARTALSLDDIKIIGGPLLLATDRDVDQAETELGITFPSGYREYVTRLGDGIFGGYYVRVYPPQRILSGSNNVQEWRERVDMYWFWDEGMEVLTKAQVLESVIIGDTLDGDELIVHPSNPQRVYVLPRHSETIYVAGDGLLAALGWLSSAGILTEAYAQREFEPNQPSDTPS
jgi:hypothetical protein